MTIKAKRITLTVFVCLFTFAVLLSGITLFAKASAEETSAESTVTFFSGTDDIEKVYKNNTGVSNEYRAFTEAEWDSASTITNNATLLYKIDTSVDANDMTALRLKLNVKNVHGLNNAEIQLGLLSSSPAEGSSVGSYLSSESEYANQEYALDNYGIRWAASYSDLNPVFTNGEMTVTLALNETTRYVFARNEYNADESYLKSVDTIGIRIIYTVADSRKGFFAPTFELGLQSAEFVGNAEASEICGVVCDEVRQQSVTLYGGNSSEIQTAFYKQDAVSDSTEKGTVYGMNEENDLLVLTNSRGDSTLSFVFSQSVDISSFRKPAIKVWMYLEGGIYTDAAYNVHLGVFSSEDALNSPNGSGKPYGNDILDRYGVRIQDGSGQQFSGASEGWNLVVLPLAGSTSSSYAGFQINGSEARTLNGAKLDGFAFRAHSSTSDFKWGIYSIEVVDLEDYDSESLGVLETRAASDTELTAIAINEKTESGIALTESDKETSLTYTLQKQYANHANDVEITWASDNENVATVNTEGKVTAVGNGSATVTVTATKGDVSVSDSVSVSVSGFKVLTGVGLDQSLVYLYVDGGKETLTYKLSGDNFIDGENNGATVSFHSSDEQIAKVDSATGEITAVAAGDATVTVTASLNGVEKTAICTVKVWAFTGIEIQNASSLGINETLQIEYSLIGTNLDDAFLQTLEPKIEYTTTDSQLVSISDSGVITAGSSTGSAKITVKVTLGEIEKTQDFELEITDSVQFTGVTIEQTEILLQKGDSAQIKYSLSGTNLDSATKTVTFTSSDTCVSVDQNGNVTADSAGSATITVSVTIGTVTHTATVTVAVWEFNGIALNAEEKLLGVDEEFSLKYTLNGTNLDKLSDEKAEYTFSVRDIATIAEGTVCGASAGETVITVSVTIGGVTKTSECKITVWEFTGIEKVTSDRNVEVDDTCKLEYSLQGEFLSNTDQDISFTSSDTAVATVANDGTLTAVSVGEATITVSVKIGDITHTAEYKILIFENLLSGVAFKEDTIALTDRVPVNLEYTLDKSNADGVSFTWVSSNTSVVSVENDGKVTATGNGTAVITLTVKQGYSEYSDTLEINVSGLTIFSGVELENENLVMTQGDEQEISFRLSGENVENAQYTVDYSSSDESVVTVDESGKITAVGAGNATVEISVSIEGVTQKAVLNITVNSSNEEEPIQKSGCGSTVNGCYVFLSAVCVAACFVVMNLKSKNKR